MVRYCLGFQPLRSNMTATNPFTAPESQRQATKEAMRQDPASHTAGDAIRAGLPTLRHTTQASSTEPKGQLAQLPLGDLSQSPACSGWQ